MTSHNLITVFRWTHIRVGLYHDNKMLKVVISSVQKSPSMIDMLHKTISCSDSLNLSNCVVLDTWTQMIFPVFVFLVSLLTTISGPTINLVLVILGRNVMTYLECSPKSCKF